ncbi:MAG: co-chaperone GroES [Calditrichia bacterium]|nr:co-chaperone GroES [Calditrichia bacterium]
MNIKPLSDRVVIEPLEAEDKTSGGIYLPETAKEKPQMGKVVAAGPGKISDAGQKIAMEVKVNDKILYGKYSGTDVNFDGKDYLIMRESDILAII